MADTVESLRSDLDALRKAFEEFHAYAKPVIDGHQQTVATIGNTFVPFIDPRALELEAGLRDQGRDQG
jgi:hypothetical protein